MAKKCSLCGYFTQNDTQTECPYCGAALGPEGADTAKRAKGRHRGVGFSFSLRQSIVPLCLIVVMLAVLMYMLLKPEQVREKVQTVEQNAASLATQALDGEAEPTQEPVATDPSGNEVLPDTQLPGLVQQPEYVLAESARNSWTVSTKSDNLNMRAGPGTEYDIVGKLPSGTQVTGCGYSSNGPSNWIVVEYQGTYGWACTDYLQNNG